MAAAQEAATSGMTHVLTLHPNVLECKESFLSLLSEVVAAPAALCVSSRHLPSWRHALPARVGRAFSGGLFRVQTGQQVSDVAYGLRVYPLDVLRGLKFLSHGRMFERESLVRAAWAGVELRSVPLPTAGAVTECVTRPWGGIVHRCLSVALNVHLTMRSVVPWPHRPLVKDAAPRARMTILHPLRSLRRLISENTSPREIALAAGLGVFLGVLPLPFVHTITIIFAASFFGVNKPAAVAASQICMPPLVPALCIELGFFLRHDTFLTEVSLRTLGYEMWDRLIEWLLGSLIVAPLLAIVVSVLTYGVAILIRQQLAGAQAKTSSFPP